MRGRDTERRLVAAAHPDGKVRLVPADDPRLRPSTPADRTEADHVLEDRT